jgi:Xaa-Pro aminopeptidase
MTYLTSWGRAARTWLGVSLALLAASGCAAPEADVRGGGEDGSASGAYGIPTSRERFEIQRAIVKEKLGTALLPAMRNQGIDMWIVLERENNSDPLHDELGGGFSGVRAAFIFFDRGGDDPEKIFYGSHEQAADSVITQVYDEKKYYGYSREGLTPLLREAVHRRQPRKIGVNTSATLPEADGLTVGLKDFLAETVGADYARRIVSAELVVRDFRTRRTPLETQLYTRLLDWSSRWMTEALSSSVVAPGRTTAEDVAWWLRDRALELGLVGSGTVRVVRKGDLLPLHDPKIPIEPGDILSIDGGLEYLGYATDIKRAAYVLKAGETALPANLEKAWEETLAIGDLYASKMVPGGIGHEIWAAINAETEKRGYRAAGPDAGGRAATDTSPEVGVYGHSVGNVAHDIGARIAADIPFAYGNRVRFPLAAGEWVSIEFHVSTPITEWEGKTWYARFEETAQVEPAGARWMIPRQEELLLIGPAAASAQH